MANCSHLFVTWLILERVRDEGRFAAITLRRRTFLMNITGIDWAIALIIECGRSIAILREFCTIETSSRSSCRTPTNTISAFLKSREYRCVTERHRQSISPSLLRTRSLRSSRSFSLATTSSCRRLNSRNFSCRAFCSWVISSNSRRCCRLASSRVDARLGSYDVHRRCRSRSFRAYSSGNSAFNATRRSNSCRSLWLEFFLDEDLRNFSMNAFHSSNVRQTHSHVVVLNE